MYRTKETLVIFLSTVIGITYILISVLMLTVLIPLNLFYNIKNKSVNSDPKMDMIFNLFLALQFSMNLVAGVSAATLTKKQKVFFQKYICCVFQSKSN